MSITPTSIRDLTFRDIQGRLSGDRVSVYDLLTEHGPCTTRELAERSGWCILSIRPRITELFQLGFVLCEEPPHSRREGIYRALTTAEAEALFQQRQEEAENGQLEIPL